MRGARMLARARRLQADLMQSRCIIRRTIVGALDESTGLYQDLQETVYDGPCALMFGNAASREVTPQAQSLAEQNPTLKLPVDSSAGVTVDDVGVLTVHPFDPGAVGLTFRIAGLHTRTHATARRLAIEVIT